MSYRFKDWVVYDPGYGEPEIGRVVAAVPGRDSTFVCFHQGCTSEPTPNKFLRPATCYEMAIAPEGIGYHRFDRECPDYVPGVCSNCWVDVIRGVR